MATVLVTPIVNGELGETVKLDFDDWASANEWVDNAALKGYVGCVKLGDSVKRVF